MTNLETSFLMKAIKAENLDAVKSVLRLADIRPDIVRDSLRHLRTNVELAAYLIDKGADIKTPDLLKDTVLKCTVPLMAFFIEKGCLLTMTKCKNNNKSVIGLLLFDGDHHEKLQLLLRCDAPFPTVDDESKKVKCTPLYHALTLERPKCLDLIFDCDNCVVHDVGLIVFLEIFESEPWISGDSVEGHLLKRLLAAGVRYPEDYNGDGVRYPARPKCTRRLQKHDIRNQHDCDAYREREMRRLAEEVRLQIVKLRHEERKTLRVAEEARVADFEEKAEERRQEQQEELCLHIAEREREEDAAKNLQEHERLEALPKETKVADFEKKAEENLHFAWEQVRVRLEREREEAVADAEKKLQEHERLEALPKETRVADFEKKAEERRQEELRLHIAEQVRLRLEREREVAMVDAAKKLQEHERLDDIERRRQQNLSESLRLCEIEEVQKLAAERDRMQEHQAKLDVINRRRQYLLDEQRKFAETEQARRLAAEEGRLASQRHQNKRKTDLKRPLRETLSRDFHDLLSAAEAKPDVAQDMLGFAQNEEAKQCRQRKEEQANRTKLDEIEQTRRKRLIEHLRLAEIEDARRLVIERDRLSSRQEKAHRRSRVIAKLQRIASDPTAFHDNNGTLVALGLLLEVCDDCPAIREYVAIVADLAADQTERFKLLHPIVDHIIGLL